MHRHTTKMQRLSHQGFFENNVILAVCNLLAIGVIVNRYFFPAYYVAQMEVQR